MGISCTIPCCWTVPVPLIFLRLFVSPHFLCLAGSESVEGVVEAVWKRSHLGSRASPDQKPSHHRSTLLLGLLVTLAFVPAYFSFPLLYFFVGLRFLANRKWPTLDWAGTCLCCLAVILCSTLGQEMRQKNAFAVAMEFSPFRKNRWQFRICFSFSECFRFIFHPAFLSDLCLARFRFYFYFGLIPARNKRRFQLYLLYV